MTVSCGSFKKYFQKIFFISLLTLASWTKNIHKALDIFQQQILFNSPEKKKYMSNDYK